MTDHTADIKEDHLMLLSPELLAALLKDQTRSKKKEEAKNKEQPEELKQTTAQENIFWATRDYAHLGEPYAYDAPILPELITGEHGSVIQPRVMKRREQQVARAKNMAEVFTPSWVCNAQNNLIDEAWFGRKNVFNTEVNTADGQNTGAATADGQHTWLPNQAPIVFPEGKTWRDYVSDTRMEITCGEAPYLASRYDTTTGDTIPLPRRIGLLDRKLRVVSENTRTRAEWLEGAQAALRSIYAYEWQGDSLLLAREALLQTVMEYHEEKFGGLPPVGELLKAAEIISWNVFQMDGLRGVIPDSCGMQTAKEPQKELSLFGEPDTPAAPKLLPCPGCKKGGLRGHNGTYVVIKDWEANKEILFIDLLKP